MRVSQPAALNTISDVKSQPDRLQLVRRKVLEPKSPADVLTANLASEFLTTALFAAVTTSMVTALAAGRQIRFNGNVSTFFPRRPELFPSVMMQSQDVFLTHRLTGELSRLYQQVAFALEMTPYTNEAWRGTASDVTPDWRQLTQVWHPLSGEFRMFLLLLADMEPIRSSVQVSRLLEIEGLVKSARYGGTPCVRSDGVVFVPGWLDRRSDRRVPVGISVRLDCGRGYQRVTLNDISVSGAGLSSCPSLKSGTQITLELPNGRILNGHSAWCHGNTVGVRFSHPLNEADPLFLEVLSLRRTAHLESDE
jgi:PilZ domain